MTNIKHRFHYIDLLNCLAIIFVLFMHSAQLANFGSYHFKNYLMTQIIQLVCVPAVYIFFMNSGATLLDYRRNKSTKEFFIRRGHRVVVPFLIWSILYYIINVYFVGFPGPIAQSNPGVKSFIKAFLNNDINNIFWFFYAIIALYLVTPIFSLLLDHKKVLISIVIVWFIFNDGIYYIEHLINIKIATRYINQPLLSSSYIGYFVLGYLIRINYFSRHFENTIVIIGIFSLVLNIVNTITRGDILYFNNIGPFFYSISIVLLIKKVSMNIKNVRCLHLFSKLSSASLGIYILHPIFYSFIDKIWYGVLVNHWSAYLNVLNKPLHIFILPIVTYLCLTLVILFCKKSKMFRIMIP